MLEQVEAKKQRHTKARHEWSETHSKHEVMLYPVLPDARDARHVCS
jgi:hypothetical protein